MPVVPYTFANQSGQIPLSELDVNFANVKAFADTAGNVTGNVQANITGLGTLTTLSVSGNITAANVTSNVFGTVNGSLIGNVTGNVVGNVTGNVTGSLSAPGSNTQVMFNDNGTISGFGGMTFDKSSSTLVIAGNINGANLRTTGSVTATGNVSAANLDTTGLVSATGTITSAANITGANFTTAGISSATGNIIGANFITSGLISATGNVLGANILASGSISATANITAANLSVTGTSILTGVATAPTAANGTSNTQIATTAFVQNSLTGYLPSGVIVMWSGSIASIPTGWLLCNGTSGTPDLRNRFIVGAGSTYAVAATGGSADSVVVSHLHTASSVVTDPGHLHSYTAPSGLDTGGSFGSAVVDTTTSANTSIASTGITVATTIGSTGVSGTNANLPPYYALAYIMKA